jgi:hypothetical protein
MAGYVALCWMLLMQTIPLWISTNEHCNQLVKNYQPFLKYDRVYVLDAPAYYNGIAAFRSAFRPTMYFKYDLPLEKIRFITGSYHDTDADSLISAHLSISSFEIKGKPRKTPYFCTDGGWAKSYETDEYSVTFDPKGCSYILRFKQEIPANSAFIYAVNGRWKMVH